MFIKIIKCLFSGQVPTLLAAISYKRSDKLQEGEKYLIFGSRSLDILYTVYIISSANWPLSYIALMSIDRNVAKGAENSISYRTLQ
jgi:hypothetical protein